MREENEILKKYNIHPKKYKKLKKVTYIETDTEKYIIKKNQQNNEIREYLKSKNFNHMPETITESEEEYEITKYIAEYKIPREQKIIDLATTISLLHNKTTHYKEITEETYNEIYNELKEKIEILYNYYIELITIIESKVYMSPCEYLIARNISIVFQALEESKEELKKWHKSVKKDTKQRLVVLHNNLELDHFIDNTLISWDNSKIGMPPYDIYNLYTKHALEFEFNEVLKAYEKHYPLTENEKQLLFILMKIPPKIEMNKTEYENTKEAGKQIKYIYKSMKLTSPKNSNKRPEDYTDKNKN